MSQKALRLGCQNSQDCSALKEASPVPRLSDGTVFIRMYEIDFARSDKDFAWLRLRITKMQIALSGLKDYMKEAYGALADIEGSI